MTLPTQPERGAEQPSEGLPIPKLETPSPASSPSSVDIDAIAKQVADKIQRDLRMAQSNKDKEIAAIKKRLDMPDLAELEAMGATIPENVKTEYRFRNLEQRPSESSPEQPASSPGNGAALTAQDVSEVVKKFNLDANEPDVLDVLRGTYRNRDHFEASLASLALARVNRPQPSAAESSAISAGAVSQSVDVNQLNNEVTQLARNPSRPGAMARMAEIKKKLQEAGA
jgi:hypothetical protein